MCRNKHDHESNTDRSAGPDGGDLESLLQEFIGPLIHLLEPHDAEIVWRAEILRQPVGVIANELGLHEQMVTGRLRAGRRALIELVTLTLEPQSTQ